MDPSSPPTEQRRGIPLFDLLVTALQMAGVGFTIAQLKQRGSWSFVTAALVGFPTFLLVFWGLLVLWQKMCERLPKMPVWVAVVFGVPGFLGSLWLLLAGTTRLIAG
jgi:hypothetical protein